MGREAGHMNSWVSYVTFIIAKKRRALWGDNLVGHSGEPNAIHILSPTEAPSWE